MHFCDMCPKQIGVAVSVSLMVGIVMPACEGKIFILLSDVRRVPENLLSVSNGYLDDLSSKLEIIS